VNSEHLPTSPEGKYIHLMEECAEVTKVCSKILRFGLDNYHPDRPEDGTNLQKIRAEMEDLRFAMDRVEELL
jgi:hypothetical protein